MADEGCCGDGSEGRGGMGPGEGGLAHGNVATLVLASLLCHICVACMLVNGYRDD